MRYNHNKTDRNQKEIVRILRRIPNLSVRTGVDDILIGYQNVNYWIEIKSPDEIAKGTGKPVNRKSETKDKQDKLLATWPGQYDICSDLEGILRVIGIIDKNASKEEGELMTVAIRNNISPYDNMK